VNHLLKFRVVDPNPDPAFHWNADPHSDPAFHMITDPDSTVRQSDENLWPLTGLKTFQGSILSLLGSPRLYFEPLKLLNLGFNTDLDPDPASAFRSTADPKPKPYIATGVVINFFLANLLDIFLRFVAHVPIPTQKDIEEALLRRKKQELLEMYALDVDMEVPVPYTPADMVELKVFCCHFLTFDEGLYLKVFHKVIPR
jgi:hypothetical protein